MKQITLQTRVYVGIINGHIKDTPEIFVYDVFLENYHQPQQSIMGVPLFNFEFNGIIYPTNSRVLCLLKDSDYSQVYILGRIYDPNVTTGSIPPNPGESQINSSLDAKSGLGPLGANDNFIAFGGSSYLKLNSTSVNINVSDSFLIQGEQGSLKLIADLNNSQGIVIRDGFTNIISNDGFQVLSKKGGITLKGNNFQFFDFNSEKPFLYFSKNALRFISTEFLSIVSVYSFTGGNGTIKGKSTSVDWNILKGSYAFRLGTGDFKVNLLNSTKAEAYFKIGIGPVYLSQFILNESKLETKIGSALPDYLKLGGGEFIINVGNTPGLQSEFLVDGSTGSLKITGATGSSSYEYTSSSITYKNSGTSGSATLEIASGKLTLTSASKTMGGKIILDGEVEVTGKLTVKGDDGLEVTKDVVVKGSKGIEASSGDVKAGTISLKQHKHASAVPGGPAPPLPG